MDQIFENIRTRRSVREFLDKRIAREDLETIVQAGAWAPTAMNKQTFQFTVLTDKEEIASLAAAVGAALGNPAYDFYRPAALVRLGGVRARIRRAEGHLRARTPFSDPLCGLRRCSWPRWRPRPG